VRVVYSVNIVAQEQNYSQRHVRLPMSERTDERENRTKSTVHLNSIENKLRARLMWHDLHDTRL